MQETREMWIQSLSQEYPLEKEMAPYSGIFLPGKCQDRGAWWATVYGVAKESDTT